MADYWLDLFTPQTWEEAKKRNFKVTGFRKSRWPIVQKIKPGDFFICYITRLGRFSGILKAISKPYQDENKARQIWKQDFFPSLIDVEPIFALDFFHSVPKDEIISKLSIASSWGGYVRGSPVRIPYKDGELIRNILKKSNQEQREYPITKKITKAKTTKRKVSAQEYGTPIDFRGLRHAPLNEQGVVYLFALVARDLGFTVEAIGTSFPDCEVKRRIDRKGARWQRVRVEFEYNSSEFKRHGHSIEGCDLIVCWKDDWDGCPIEVLELATTIKKLGARFEE